jgi:hypothetical protein
MLKRTAVVASLVGALVLGASAAGLAGNGNGANKSSSSIFLVTMNSSTASATATSAPRWSDQVTFDVSTTATDRPYVTLNCYQNGVWVYAAGAGFWSGYAYGKVFNLAANSWSGGAADCTATLGALNLDGTRFRELASTSFHVDA